MSEAFLVKHSAPTLAGIKTANLFTCAYHCIFKLSREIAELNRQLKEKGVRIRLLRCDKGRALVYAYRPQKLGKDLNQEQARILLDNLGYEWQTEKCCLKHLASQLQKKDEFPHEIGLFLGYPLSDVQGFIEHKGKNSKCTGYWKVYADLEKAKKTFDTYKKCTELYCRKIEKGCSIVELTVAI